MKVGDYVRTVGGLIGKVIEIEGNAKTYEIPNRQENDVIEIIKSSPNIIDLIEVGDYVNETRVTNISKEQGKNIEIYLDTDDLFEQTIYKNEDIKSIVTREQFSQMEYRIGE